MRVEVECHAGYRSDETPRRFVLEGRRVEVAEVVERWAEPERRCFRVLGDDGAVRLLSLDLRSGEWSTG